MRTPRHFVILALAIGVISLHAWAGTQNATITGSVYVRSSGAQLSGATVRLINAGIGFSQTQISGSDGTYSFNNVPPAENYVISVEKSGFSPVVLTNIVVQVDEEKLVLPPFRLEATVQANPPVVAQTPTQAPAQVPAPAPKQSSKAPSVSLDLLSTTQSGVEDTRSVHTLPLLNRDFIDLALLVPGTYPVEQGSVLQGASLVVNGARADMNNFLLDGADNNDYTINQSLPFQIVEAMQEFRVQASTESAEFGRSGGAQINAVSRSGSNAVHGELFEFNRNSALSARNFFSAYSGGSFDQFAGEVNQAGFGNPLTDPKLASLYNLHNPQVNQNQFGGNIGGALAKDKLFGFFNWESFRLSNPRPLFEQVPGIDLRSTANCPAFVGQATPCDPTALALFNLYPAPNVPVTPFSDPNTLTTPNFLDTSGFPVGSGAFSIGQSTNRTSSDNFLGRIDWRVSDRASMSFKHNVLLIDQVQGGDVPASSTYPGNGTHVGGRDQNFSYNYVQQFTPRTANEFRFGWNRFRLTTTARDASINPATLGFQNLNSNTSGLPILTVGGGIATFGTYSSLGSNFTTPSKRADNVWSLADNLSLTRGRHTWKFGGEFRHVRLNIDNEAAQRGLVTFFSAPFVAANGTPDIASIARVCPQSLPSFGTVFATPCAQFGSGLQRHFTSNSYDAYIQDQWRVSHNFTVNYGIRYEINTAPVEQRNLLVNFYPALGTQGALVRGGSTTEFDPFGNVIGTAPHSAPRAGYNTDFNNWGPRLGFAWDPWSTGKTVVRGGYALMFDQQPFEPSVNQLLNPPFIQQNFGFFNSPGPSGTTVNGFALADTFSACSPQLLVGTGGCLSTSSDPNSTSEWFRYPYSITAIDPHNKTSYIHQFHFGVEQQLGGKAVFEVAYVGSAAHRLPQLRDSSECTPSEFFSTFDPATGGDACFNFAQNPFLFPSIINQQNTANSNFHSLQVRFEARNFHGLQLRAFYVWAKSIDNSSSLQSQQFLVSPLIASLLTSVETINPDNFAGVNNISPALTLQGTLPVITTRPRLPQDSSNLAGERALSDFDIRHRFVLDYIYSVPRFAPRIGTGWQLAGITTLQSGQPFTVFLDYFGTPLRPNVLGPVPIDNNNPQGAIDNGIPMNTPGSVFDLSQAGQLKPGSLGRNAFRAPKFVNTDFAILKNNHLGKNERANMQFRVEFFNIFNNANFRQPYSRGGVVFDDLAGNFCGAGKTCLVNDPFFGQILQAFPSREVQFALKFSF
ncbi:MAG: carboxypeptidase regulatory-like domain-containing protein [Candidatus Acidiferrales bacterium]